MILTNRLFERVSSNRDAKSVYIFCEGVKREIQYLRYFRQMDTRINLEVYELNADENNSPLGLLEIVKKSVIKSSENPNPKYSFQKNDEVWIVLDTDKGKDNSRKPQINNVRNEIASLEGWFVVECNPCFEVWLYYHLNAVPPLFEGDDMCSNWKEYVNNSISGGFDSRKHPILIEDASKNAEAYFTLDENSEMSKGATQVFQLSKSILPILLKKINKAKEHI